MREILVELAQLARRPAVIGYILGLMIPWALYSWNLGPDTGAREGSRSVIDAAIFQLLLASLQASMVRRFAKDRIALGAPRWLAWITLTIVIAPAMYALAFGIQIFALLVAKESVVELSWHREAEGALAFAILFPCVVWQVALIAGEPRVGLKRSWRGIWTRRLPVLAMVFAIVAGFATAQSWLGSVTPLQPDGIELPLWWVALLLPGCAGYVFLSLLALVTFLAIQRDLAAESAVFD